MKKLFALSLTLASCHHDAIEGEWRSNEGLTQASLRRFEARLTPRQRELWQGPGFFGKLVLSFHGDRVVDAYEGTCSTSTYVVSKRAGGELEIHTHDAKTGDDGELVLSDGMLQTRLANGRFPNLDPFRELFTRVTRPEAEAIAPCLK